MRVKGFKAFNKDLSCRGYKYEIGKTATMSSSPELCRKGFHFCTKINDVFYYYPHNSRVCVVEARGTVVGDHYNGDTKLATNELYIERELSADEIRNLVAQNFDYGIQEYMNITGKFELPDENIISQLGFNTTKRNTVCSKDASGIVKTLGLLKPVCVLNSKYNKMYDVGDNVMIGNRMFVKINKDGCLISSMALYSARTLYDLDDAILEFERSLTPEDLEMLR